MVFITALCTVRYSITFGINQLVAFNLSTKCKHIDFASREDATFDPPNPLVTVWNKPHFAQATFAVQ